MIWNKIDDTEWYHFITTNENNSTPIVKILGVWLYTWEWSWHWDRETFVHWRNFNIHKVLQVSGNGLRLIIPVSVMQYPLRLNCKANFSTNLVWHWIKLNVVFSLLTTVWPFSRRTIPALNVMLQFNKIHLCFPTKARSLKLYLSSNRKVQWPLLLLYHCIAPSSSSSLSVYASILSSLQC